MLRWVVGMCIASNCETASVLVGRPSCSHRNKRKGMVFTKHSTTVRSY